MGLGDKIKGVPAEIVNPIADHALDRVQEMIDESGAKVDASIDRRVDHFDNQLAKGLADAAETGKGLLLEARRMADDDLSVLADYQIVIRIGLEKKP